MVWPSNGIYLCEKPQAIYLKQLLSLLRVYVKVQFIKIILTTTLWLTICRNRSFCTGLYHGDLAMPVSCYACSCVICTLYEYCYVGYLRPLYVKQAV